MQLRWRWFLTVAIGLLPALAMVAPQPVAAQTPQQVTVSDASPAYPCTRDGLAAAIGDAATNDPANPGLVTFDCANPTITFPDSNGEISLDNVAVIVDGENGDGEQIILDGNGNTQLFGIGWTSTVTFQHVTLQDGSDGAISNGGTLNISESSFISNRAYSGSSIATGGAAIYNGYTAKANISQSSFISNYVTVAYFGWGGAIYNNGKLEISQSSFVGNRVNDAHATGGGAIYNGHTAKANISQSSFIDNTAIDGGAIYNHGGALTIGQSTFTDNVAKLSGGAIKNGGTVNVSQSSFIDNTAKVGGAIDGGDSSMETMITSSTFSGNSANTGASIAAVSTSLRWSTIVQPDEVTTPALHLGDSVNLEGVILAGSGDHCAGNISQLTDSYTLANDDSCGLDGEGSQENVTNLQLGKLQTVPMPYGVEQSSYPLLEGSPAIDTGGLACASPDQLGNARPYPNGGFCDIGAIESPFIVFRPVGLCANRWSGELRMPRYGRCASNETLLNLPADGPLTLCANRWTGEARYSQYGRCHSTETSHEAVGNDSIPVCINRWSGNLRVSQRCYNTERSDTL